MSYNSNDGVSRDDLYRRFRESLSKPITERFFDEDELVDIFDYAGDIDDAYARVEVLCCGARLYPESLALADRRALLYLDEDDSDAMAKAYLADNPSISTALTDIVRLEVNRPEPDKAAAALEFLLSQYDLLSDEETIRLVDLAIDMDMYPWLLDNLDILRAKTSFLPSLLYEILNEADSRDDFATGIRLADELIELEPFAVSYWGALFKAHARAGHTEEARSAFDYAKALTADDHNAALWLCDAVVRHAPYLASDAIPMIKAMVDDEPDNFEFVDYLCGLTMHAGRPQEGVDIVKAYLDRNPDDFHALRRLLFTNADGCAPYVEAYYALHPEGFDEDTLDEIVNTLLLNNAMRSLAAFLEMSSARGLLTVSHTCALIEAYFAGAKFTMAARAADSLRDFTPLVEIPLKGAAAAAAAVISYMKTGQESKAKNVVNATRRQFEATMDIAPMPVRMVLRSALATFDAVERHPASDTLFWQYHDPYRYGR